MSVSCIMISIAILGSPWPQLPGAWTVPLPGPLGRVVPGEAESSSRVRVTLILILLSPVPEGVLILQSASVQIIVMLPLKDQPPRIELLKISHPAVPIPRPRTLIRLAEDDEPIQILTDIDDLHRSF